MNEISDRKGALTQQPVAGSVRFRLSSTALVKTLRQLRLALRPAFPETSAQMPILCAPARSVVLALTLFLLVPVPTLMGQGVTQEAVERILLAIEHGDSEALRSIIFGVAESEQAIRMRNPQFAWESEIARFRAAFDSLAKSIPCCRNSSWTEPMNAVLPIGYEAFLLALNSQAQSEVVDIRNGTTVWVRVRFLDARYAPIDTESGSRVLREGIFVLQFDNSGLLKTIRREPKFDAEWPEAPARINAARILSNGVIELWVQPSPLRSVEVTIGSFTWDSERWRTSPGHARATLEHREAPPAFSSEVEVPGVVRIVGADGSADSAFFALPAKFSGKHGFCLTRVPWDPAEPEWLEAGRARSAPPCPMSHVRGGRLEDEPRPGQPTASDDTTGAEADDAATVVSGAFSAFLEGKTNAFGEHAYRIEQPGLCSGKRRTIDECVAEEFRHRGRPVSHRAVSVPYGVPIAGVVRRIVVLESSWEKDGAVVVICQEVVMRPSDKGWQVMHLSRGPEDCGVIRDDVLEKTGYDVGTVREPWP